MASRKAPRSASTRTALILGSLLSLLPTAGYAQGAPPGYGPVANPAPGGPAPNAPLAAPAQATPSAPVGPAQTQSPPQPQPGPAPIPAPAPAPPPAAAPAPALAPPPTIPPAPPTPAPAPPPPAAEAPATQAAIYPPQPGAAPPPETLSDQSAGRSEDDDERSHCVGGEFCIGPMLTGGVLNVFGFGLHARMDYWGLGFDYQFISLGYREVDGNLKLISIDARVFPGGGVFYFSAGIAWQSIAFETAVNVTVENVTQRVTVQGSTVLPLLKLGFGFQGRDGFVMGIDLGFGFRLDDVSVDLTTDVDELLMQTGLDALPEVIQARADFRAAAEEWIEWLPFTLQFNVLRIGYLF